MRKSKMILLVLCVTLMLLSGCGQQKAPTTTDVTTISISQDGDITYYLTEEFDKEYYDINELKDMALQEVTDYNARSGSEQAVTVEKVGLTEDGKKAVVTYSLLNVETFRDFTDVFLEYDTVENARLSGYLKDGMSFYGKDGKFDINQDIFLKYAKNHVIIADAESVIYPPYKVMYYSEGVTIREDGSIDPVAPADKNQKIILILKK